MAQNEMTEKYGLGHTPEADWPRAPDGETPPIELLRPGSRAHDRVLQYLKVRINASEREMKTFYPRWAISERKAQAYINLPDYEQMLKEMTDAGKPPKITSITVPYIFSTINTIVTYLLHTFTGNQPIFPVRSNKSETAQAAPYMEHALQYNADHVRMVNKLYQFFMDGELYGTQILRTRWKDEQRMRTVWKEEPTTVMGVPTGGSERVRSREMRTVFQGTDVMNVDPYHFLPDPRVPMAEVNRKGEFVFWFTYQGRHELKRAEADGLIRWLDAVPRMQSQDRTGLESARGLLSRGSAHPGARNGDQGSLSDYVKVTQGSCEIIPAELGLGESREPEKWLFSIGNMGQILQAEPLELDHGMHPVVVGEPYSMGYGFGQAGSADYLGPIQDSVSWFINSHIHNVRAALNNMLIVDPSMIEMQDLTNPEPGGIIRLKRAAFGQDVRTAVQQMNIQDITRGHINDLELFMRMGDSLSAVNDNLRGIQDSGGRKTATEVRTSGEAGASRLAAHAKLISSQAITDLTEQMCVNFQQNLTEEFAVQVIGREGVQKLVHIVPDMLVGDFFFPVNDGTLPIDKVAMLDVWKELYLGIAQDRELRSQYNMVGLFDYIAELGGAKNLDQFLIQTAGPGQPGQPDPVEAGNAVPLQDALQNLGQGPSARAISGPGGLGL